MNHVAQIGLVELSKLAFSRKRWPIGGYCVPVRLDAQWRAGQM